jgi:hypothetical protein
MPSTSETPLSNGCLVEHEGRAGYPEWDEDMPSGCDQIAEVSKSEQGQLRFETVLAEQLNSLLA